jgi:hypothetical protein
MVIIQSFNHSIIQSFNHSIIQSFNHSIIIFYRFLPPSYLNLLGARIHMVKRMVGCHIEGLGHILAAGALAGEAGLAAEVRLQVNHITAVEAHEVTRYHGAVKGALVGVLKLATKGGILEGTH